jgi:hypothetical protein
VLRIFTLLLLLASLADAQAPRIGIIDFYGLRKASITKVRQALGVHEGDPLPGSKGDTEERLNQVPGIVESHLEAVCCEAGKMILYVGIEEKGAAHFDLREPPEGDVRLPEEIAAAYRQFLEAVAAAALKGDAADDLTRGYSMMANPEARAIQEQFIILAKDYLKELRAVLRNSSDEEHRAAAAFIIGYAPKRAQVIDDLEYALKDADPNVRNNATRNLAAKAVLARLDPDSGVKVSPTWFIEMLNSLSWTDRNKALMALQILTDDRDPLVLDQLRDRAMASLVEMARWKTLGHALPAYVLLGRLAGIPEPQIQDAWSRGDRESVIAQAMKKKR